MPPVVLGGAWEDWFHGALVLLVIALPCALVISMPVSIVASLAASARVGVLIKGGAFIELPARLKAIAMDETGTITREEPAVVRVLPLGNRTEPELITRALALEARSTHPLARAIIRYAEYKGIPAEPANDVQVLKGKGLTGTFSGEPFWLGSRRYASRGGRMPLKSPVRPWARGGWQDRACRRQRTACLWHAEFLPEDKLRNRGGCGCLRPSVHSAC